MSEENYDGGKRDSLVIDRYFSRGGDPYKTETFDYSPREVIILGSDGTPVEKVEGVIAPKSWSQNSVNTVATKYFRKGDIPGFGRETDLRQLTGRVAQKISYWGSEQRYFDNQNAENLEKDLVAATMEQVGAFNSPVWFNVGLDLYGVHDEGENFYIDRQTGEVKKVDNYYAHPQGSACFISHPEDTIKDMMRVAANFSSEIFRNGSGIGSSWYRVRGAGEPISGGGIASGAKRFMDVQDSVARVIKSGGKTRRAAVLQNIPSWHPDMIEIIKEKYMEEEKARILIDSGSPGNWESHTIQNLRGQNVNYSVLTDNAFWEAVERDDVYQIRQVKDGKVIREPRARDLLTQMAYAAHGCGDPGIQNFDTMNEWNTCKSSGQIWGSNPCSEYMFLNNSACNLASLNLMKFRKEDGQFDIESFSKAVDLYITAQDIMVSELSYPSEEIALNSHRFRPLGLGFANLGAYLMANGLAYDSEESRNFSASVASLLTSEGYLQSTRIAEKMGAFEEFEVNRDDMLAVIEKHRKAAGKLPLSNGLEGMVRASMNRWEEAERNGEKFGFRNSQVTLLAPTGTIGFMMDCDTTGCEPEFALVKYKDLAGGGSMKIVNQTVPLALNNLGYSRGQVEDIVSYIAENDTIEGAPHLNEKHLPVFDCAITPFKGERSIEPMGHLRMMGALQPHLSGAISKTLNCPGNISVDEMADLMYQSWKLGTKAVAFYRDGSKAAQPMKTKKMGGLEIITRGKREHLPSTRKGITQKIKIGTDSGPISLFLRTGEYMRDRAYLEEHGYRGVLGELFIDSLERGTEVNRLLNENAIQFSEKLQLGMPLEEALEVFRKSGSSQISGITDHPFITNAKGPEGFIHDWVMAHYAGNIEGVPTSVSERELRPLPSDLRIFQKVPALHLKPSVAGENFYTGAPTLEETIKLISNRNYWLDEGLDTRQTLERIRKNRKWKDSGLGTISLNGKTITGQSCSCGSMMIPDGKCWKCPSCKTTVGGCSA